MRARPIACAKVRIGTRADDVARQTLAIAETALAFSAARLGTDFLAAR
jgi:hypothetical protein